MITSNKNYNYIMIITSNKFFKYYFNNDSKYNNKISITFNNKYNQMMIIDSKYYFTLTNILEV